MLRVDCGRLEIVNSVNLCLWGTRADASLCRAAFPFVLVNSVLGTLVAYGLAGLRDQASAVFLNALFSALEGLISTQLLISCVWLTPNQVRNPGSCRSACLRKA